MVGLNMGAFQRSPSYQEGIMKELTEIHKASITIMDQFAADIVITPIKNEAIQINGYAVMLMV
jgi:rsbT co-antagonist protein RsbR